MSHITVSFMPLVNRTYCRIWMAQPLLWPGEDSRWSETHLLCCAPHSLGGTVLIDDRLKYLKMALYAIGVIFIVGVPLLMTIWPDGFGWDPAQSEYEQMILGIYVTLGVFLIFAAKDPLANRSLIWFTVWSSLVHGGIMLVQAIVDDTERVNLMGDVPSLLIVAAVLGFLMPKGGKATA